jgi:hypothetical protein
MDYLHAFHEMTAFLGRHTEDRYLRPFVTRLFGPPVNLVATGQSSGV